ncbi:MAG: PKD domain-containing protein [Bacteroidia bacterium]|nr:PKD domain-containing protein [Bacteroidia bacterium]
MLKYTLILFLLVICSLKIQATHIVGGEIYYDYLGGGQYKITLKIYRDCYNGIPPLDNPAHIDIFDKNGNVIKSRNVALLSISNIPSSINNSCIIPPDNVCVQEGIYEFTETLPPIPGGYYIVYQRCCRNHTILNIVNPGGIGATYWEHIPGSDEAFPNSSPRFKKFPPLYICNGLNINFDHSATDPDGDVLIYSLCNAYNGLDGCCPIISSTYVPSQGQYCNTPPPSCPVNCSPPPYSSIPYLAPYNGTYPLSSNPAININPNTGLLTGKPNLNGQWVVSVCVSEYRNGQLIGIHQREFQFNVVTCSITVVSAIQDQSQKCDGYTINFSNQSIGGNTFFWNFGDPTTLADTSHLTNPSYTYPDTGTYQVTLIANPGKPCSDTSIKTFYVYPKFAPQFTPPSGQCVINNSFSFQITGSYANYSQFSWNFGPNATPSLSNLSNPTGVHFNSSGIFPVTVTVTQQPCKAELTGTIEVYPYPSINPVANNYTICQGTPLQLNIEANNLNNPLYQWFVSNGFSSNHSNPSLTFNQSGIYGYSVNIINTSQCTVTFNITAPNAITVYPTPFADFIFTPTLTTVFDPEITFTDMSYAGNFENNSGSLTQWHWELGDGNTISNALQFIHSYGNYGNYPVQLIITNNFGCKDTVTKIITILPEFRFWVPNAFTPNNDGLNDEFLPIVIGIENYTLEIFDRWGEKIFSTNQYKQGWNGYYKGSACKEDVYVWKIGFKNLITKKYEEHVGHVTLLR